VEDDAVVTQDPKTQFDRVFRLYWIPIIAVILYVILDAVVQSLPPHYSWIRDAESDLAVGPYGYIMAVNFINRGILSLVFIYAFMKTIELTGGSKAVFRRGYYLLGIWGVGAILLAFFPTDVPATPVSWHGAIHLVVALIAFITGAVGIFVLSRHFGENRATKGIKGFALALGSLSIVLLLLPLSAQLLKIPFTVRIGGLTERLFLASVLLWILAVSAYMIANRRSIVAAVPSAGQTPDGPAK
jgi:hypothetical membrane protein